MSNEELGPQIREYEDTFSPFKMLEEHYINEREKFALEAEERCLSYTQRWLSAPKNKERLRQHDHLVLRTR